MRRSLGNGKGRGVDFLEGVGVGGLVQGCSMLSTLFPQLFT